MQINYLLASFLIYYLDTANFTDTIYDANSQSDIIQTSEISI